MQLKPHMSLFSTSLHKPCQSERWKKNIFHAKGKKRVSNQKREDVELIRQCKIETYVPPLTSRIDLTFGFWS